MRRLTQTYRAAWLCAALFVASACGGGDDGGPPPVADDDAELVPSVIGTCQKLCCSALDCAAGQTCLALDPSAGSLGTCSASAAGSSAPAPGSTNLADGCWTLNPAQCNPISNAGCASGEGCDFDEGDESIEPVVMCFANAEPVAPGERCDAVYGEPCEVGYHCLPDPS